MAVEVHADLPGRPRGLVQALLFRDASTHAHRPRDVRTDHPLSGHRVVPDLRLYPYGHPLRMYAHGPKQQTPIAFVIRGKKVVFTATRTS